MKKKTSKEAKKNYLILAYGKTTIKKKKNFSNKKKIK